MSQTLLQYMNLNFSTFNVKGLASKEKRLKIFNYLKEKQNTIFFLQKLHCVPDDHDSWKKQWGGDTYISGNSSNSKGLDIFISQNIIYNKLQYKEIISGRLQLLKLELGEKILVLINVYGPNNEDVTFLNILEETIIAYNSETLLIGGDFNTILDYKTDKLNGKNDKISKRSEKLNKIIENNELFDIWRILNPKIKEYT